MTETGLTTTPVTSTDVFTLPEPEVLRHQIQKIKEFQSIVHEMLDEGQDYGVIPGTSKPTLLKPGAEKIDKILGLADEYEIVDQVEDWNKGFFRYLIRCSLYTIGSHFLVSSGMGECNSMESKYRYRDSQRKCPNCGAEAIIPGKKEYGGGFICWKKKGGCEAKYSDDDKRITDQVVGKVENEDIFSLVNTILKMSKKRAHVDATLSAGRLSNVFTQDIEDMPEFAGKVQSTKPEPENKTGKQQQSAPEKEKVLKKNPPAPAPAVNPASTTAKENTIPWVMAKILELNIQEKDIWKTFETRYNIPMSIINTVELSKNWVLLAPEHFADFCDLLKKKEIQINTAKSKGIQDTAEQPAA
jgi:hypothetical protein